MVPPSTWRGPLDGAISRLCCLTPAQAYFLETTSLIWRQALPCGRVRASWSRIRLTLTTLSGIKDLAAVAATRGDLGQLAPRKKLLKSFVEFPRDPPSTLARRVFQFHLP